MERNLGLRVAALERAALSAEGSQFAMLDVLVRSLNHMPLAECRVMIADLLDHSQELDPGLGADRLESYREGLRAILAEIEHAREEPGAAVPGQGA